MNERSKKEGYDYSKGDVVSKEEYMDMVMNSEVYKKMFEEWSKSNFSYGMTPTIDRIDSKRNYSKDNIQFLSFSDNARKNHDRENFKHLRGELIINGRSDNVMSKISSFMKKELGCDIGEITKEASFVEEKVISIEELNKKMSSYALGFKRIEDTVSEEMAKAACFSLSMADDIKINRIKLGNAIAERFLAFDKLKEANFYNEEEVRFIKTAYLVSCDESLPGEKIAQFLIINDKSFTGRGDFNYDIFEINDDQIKTSSVSDDQEECFGDASTVLTDEVMNMIRNEMGDDVADGLLENRDNTYNALPLPYKQRVNEMYNSTQQGDSKTASMMSTIGLGALGALIGRDGALKNNKGKSMDRADGAVAGGAGGLLVGQIIDDFNNGKTKAEKIEESEGLLSMPGMEGLAVGSLVGYNYGNNNKMRNTLIGGMTGAVAAEILRRSF